MGLDCTSVLMRNLAEVILTPTTDFDVPSVVEGQWNARSHTCSPRYVVDRPYERTPRDDRDLGFCF